MDAFERAANNERAADRKAGFRIHLFVYLAVQVLLVVTWWMTSNGGEVMPWFIFPLLGWGVGLVAHYAAVRGAARREGAG
jgi:cytochrome b561